MRYLTWKQLKLIVPFSRQYIYELELGGKFPKRIKFGERRVAWPADEIEEWIESKVNKRNPPAP